MDRLEEPIRPAPHGVHTSCRASCRPAVTARRGETGIIIGVRIV